MRVRNAFIYSTVSIAALATATPTFAQTPVPADSTPAETQEGEAVPPTSEPTNAEGQAVSETPATESGGAIVVTGSRIRRDNFNTPQNVDVLTRDDQVLAGTRSVAETLQTATVTSGTSQISGSFLGFLSEGGQAANTVGLRGLGSTRTLVLLNGRRLAPAGAGPQLVSADLNVLPQSAVQRIEILREGASSIYGSDAIAGVINIITDTKLDGITVDAFADVPLEYSGGGRSYRLGVTGGKTFDRGYITASFEYRQDQGLRLGDNPDWRCPRELAFVNGVEVGQGSPDDDMKLRCFPFQRASIGTAQGYGLAYTGFTYDATNGGPGTDLAGFGFLGRVTPANGGITSGPISIDSPTFPGPDRNLAPLASEMQYENHVISPIKTFSAFVNGAYELGALGDAELYGEFLFNRRKSHQDSMHQINFQSITNFGEAQLYGGNFTDYYTGAAVPCADVVGSACSPFFPTAWADSGVNYYGPFIVPNRTIRSSQKVDFWRANGGIRGNLGLGDWRYDANVMVSRTKARENIVYPLTENMNNILVAVAAPAGTPSEYTTVALPGQAAAGQSFTCASNVTNGAYNGGTCVPINMYDPAVLLGGNISDALYNYIYSNNIQKTRYEQETFNLVFDGSLFALQGGDAKGAVGFEHRRDYIKDTPSLSRQDCTIYAYSCSGITTGSDKVNELFAEIQLPLVKDKPGVALFEVDASARYTKYKSYGSDLTYHINAQYAPISAVRFRGNYGTNFRAPNLYEQFVADQVGFYPGSFDPCDDFANTFAPGTTTYDNCLAALTPVLDDPDTVANEALGYFTSGGIPVTTTGGADVLDAEKAKTWGLGVVLTAPRHIADFSLAVDFWHIKVKDEVGLLGNLILNFCYSRDDYPNNPYCALIGPRAEGEVGAGGGEITEFSNPYLNIAQQIAAGIDFDARYATRLFGGKFSTQLQATRMIDQKLEQFEGQGLGEFNGTLGYPGNGAGPKWVASLDTRFTTANDITFRWGVEYVGRSNSDALANEYFLTAEGANCTPGTDGCLPVHFDLTAEHYWEHGASIQWLWRNVGQITVGVNNLFNEKPPRISEFPDQTASYPRLGNYFANGPYDYRGRSFFINVTKTFK